MPVLFEQFVTVALREQLETACGGRVAGQDLRFLNVAGRIRLYPDIVWHRHGRPVAVADAKYKSEPPGGYPNADLYQLLAYCTALGLRCGHLVYARGAGEPAQHVIRRAGTVILAHALDLNAEPAALLSQVSVLAALIDDRAGQRPADAIALNT